jgi:hypothetical protein
MAMKKKFEMAVNTTGTTISSDKGTFLNANRTEPKIKRSELVRL